LDGSYTIEQYNDKTPGCGNFYKELEFVRNITSKVPAGSYSVMTLGYNKRQYRAPAGVQTLIEDASQTVITGKVMEIPYPAASKLYPNYPENYCKVEGKKTLPMFTKKQYDGRFKKGGQTSWAPPRVTL